MGKEKKAPAKPAAKAPAKKEPAAPAAMPASVPEAAAAAQPGMAMPGMPGGGNPMFAMMQMMQAMMGGMGGAPAMPMIDPAAVPFAQGNAVDDRDAGLDATIIRPALLPDPGTQAAIPSTAPPAETV